MAAHRYWRIVGTDFPSYIEVRTAKMYTAYGLDAVDVCTGGTAIASSTYGGYPPSNAFDTSTGSTWSTSGAGGEQWIGYDFGAGNEKDIVAFALHTSSYVPTNIYLDYSDDGANWTRQSSHLNDSGKWTQGALRGFTSQKQNSGAGHAFWRWLGTAGPANNSLNCFSDIKLLDQDGVNRLKDAVTEIQTNGAYQPNAFWAGRMLDDDLSTEYRGPNTYPCWIVLRLGERVDASALVVSIGGGYDAYVPTDASIQYSDDGENWTTAKELTGLTWLATGETKTFALDGSGPAVKRRRILSVT